MTYEPEKLKEVELPKVGTQIKGVVSELTEGKLKEFLSAEVLEKWDKSNPDSNQLEVIVELENGQIRKKLIAMPEGVDVFPNSNMGKWKKTFGAYPHKGQEVFLIVDSEGFPQFKL